MIKIKRIYDTPHDTDGFRLLVDRLWPRGVSKKDAQLDLWLKEVAPSTELRKWFSHDPEKWVEFQKRYKKELKDKEVLIGEIKELERVHTTITLLYGARDAEHNEAVILATMLSK